LVRISPSALTKNPLPDDACFFPSGGFWAAGGIMAPATTRGGHCRRSCRDGRGNRGCSRRQGGPDGRDDSIPLRASIGDQGSGALEAAASRVPISHDYAGSVPFKAIVVTIFYLYARFLPGAIQWAYRSLIHEYGVAWYFAAMS
jgi:hypothetical protein